MSSRSFKKALQEAEATQGRKKTVSVVESMSDEEIRQAAYNSRRNREANISQKMSDDSTRSQLLKQAGFDWVDIEELQPNPKNQYSMEEADIENLAGLIHLSKETEPLIVRETKDGLQIIDGERRWRAHRLLAEMYGEIYRMVPVRIHSLDSKSEEETEFILHATNAGQRKQTPAEDALGYAKIADQLVEWRKANPNLKGKKTREQLAEYFGVSERTAQKKLTIGRGLTKRCMSLYSDKRMTLDQAVAVANLSEEDQTQIADLLESRKLTAEELDAVIDEVKNGCTASVSTKEPKKKDSNGYLKSARNALKRATRNPTAVSYKLLGEVKELIRDLEQIQAELERREEIDR